MYWLKKSAAQDNTHANNIVVSLEGGDFISWVIKDAEQGDAHSQLLLFYSYLEGVYGANQNLVKSKFWLDKLYKNPNNAIIFE